MKIISNSHQKTALQLYEHLKLKLPQLFHEQTQTDFNLDFVGIYDQVKVIFTQFPDFEGFTIQINDKELIIFPPHNFEVPIPNKIVEELYRTIAAFAGNKEKE